jgi:hypothetical protein
MLKKAIKHPKPEIKGGYLENINKPLFTLEHEELREILDCYWYPRANQALNYQRKIWDYSYLAYKGIMTWDEINRKRRANNLGMYVNVPRTFMTIEGIRRNFNINKLRVNLAPSPGVDEPKRTTINSFINFDMYRGGTFKQVKNAGFDKLLYGNGFLYSYLNDRKGKYGNIVGDINAETGYVKFRMDKEPVSKYFGMVARRVSPYHVFPDPDGSTGDYNDVANTACQYQCIRHIKPLARFRRDWAGIVPQELINKVVPGGFDMTNYEAVKETIDVLFSWDAIRHTGSADEYVRQMKITTQYSSEEYVEERIWLGEDFFIMQAGGNMEFCIISPNQNPRKMTNLIKLDDVEVPGEYWSMGEPYIQRYQQVEENRAHNASLDAVMYSINGMLGINKQYLEDPYDMDMYPGKVWGLKAMPGVKIDEVMAHFQPGGNNVAGAMAFLKEIKEIGQSTTAITDFVTGASKSIADSATEANKLSGASDLAIADKVKEMAGGALTEVAKVYLSMYPVAYAGEEMKAIFEKRKICFVGKTLDEISEEELAKLYLKYSEAEIITSDDLDVTEPTFVTVGDVSMDRDGALRQWVSAIDYAKSINEVAYATGDTRRIDIVKMGLIGMENFDVVGDPQEFLMEDQPVKADEIRLNAEMNMQANQQSKAQEQNGGAPKKNKVTKPQSESSAMRGKAQPGNRGKNQSSKKNQ